MKYFKLFLFSLCIYIALFYDRLAIYPNMYTVGPNSGITTNIVAILQRFICGLGGYNSTALLSFVSILVVTYIYINNKSKISGSECILSSIFSIFMVLGNSFQTIGSWDLIFADVQLMITSFVILVGYWHVFNMCILLLKQLSKKWVQKDKNVRNANRQMLIYWAIIFVCWLPYYIIKYPGAMCVDAYNQLNQFFGVTAWGTGHPPLSTFLIGAFVWLGNKLISMEFGLFLYCIFQGLLMSFSFAYSLDYLIKRGVSKVFYVGALMFFCLNPLFPSYATTVLKDIPYSAMFLLYVVMVAKLIEDIQNWKDRKVKSIPSMLLGLFPISLIMMLLRHNGIYVVIPTFFAIVIYALTKKINWKRLVILLLLLLLPLFVNKLVNSKIYPLFIQADISTQANMAIMMQQTARYVKEYPDEVTEEEKDILNHLLDYELLGQVYSPTTFDTIGYIYRTDIETEWVKKYYKEVWIPQLMKHPGVHVQATMNMVYGLFYPGVDNVVDSMESSTNFEPVYYEFVQPIGLKGPRAILQQCLLVFKETSFLGMFENMALAVWIWMGTVVCMLKKCRWDMLISLIPIGVSVLVCMAAPSFFYHPRYAFPIVYAVIFMIGICVTEKENKKEKNK